MKPTTEVSTHAIIFKDGSKKFINEKAFNIFWNQAEQGRTEVLIDKTIISIPAIAKLIPIDEFYTEYPNQKNDYIPLFRAEERKAYGRRALEGLATGLKKYITSEQYQGTDSPKELLSLMEKQLTQKNK